jgi:hypothetical protein
VFPLTSRIQLFRFTVKQKVTAKHVTFGALSWARVTLGKNDQINLQYEIHLLKVGPKLVACALSYSPSCTHIGRLLSQSVAGSKPVCSESIRSPGRQGNPTGVLSWALLCSIGTLGWWSERQSGGRSTSRSGSVRRGLSHNSFSVLSHSAVRGLPLYAGSYPYLLVQLRVSCFTYLGHLGVR